MKKHFFVKVLIVFAISAYCNAQDAIIIDATENDATQKKQNIKANENVNLFTNTQNWSTQFAMNIEASHDNDAVLLHPDFCVALDMKELRCNAGFSVFGDNSRRFDFATEIVYAPTFFKVLNIGLGAIFHVNTEPNIFTETNFLLGLYIKYTPATWFCLSVNIFYLLKNAHIFIDENENFPLTNNNGAFKLNLAFFPTEKLSLFLDFSTYSHYKYLLAVSPIFSLGASYTFLDKVRIAFEANVQYIDFFTLSANFNGVNYKISMDFLL